MSRKSWRRCAILGVLFLWLGACVVDSETPTIGLMTQGLSTLTANPSGLLAVGTSITLTNTSNLAGSLEHKFYIREPSGGWVLGRDWDASASYVWDTTGKSKGEYIIQAWSRVQGSTAEYQDSSYLLTITLFNVGPCTNVEIVANPSSPRQAGTSVTFQYTADCGTLGEYKLYHRPSGGSWSLLHDWSSSREFVWDTTGANGGSHELQVWARRQGTTVPYESWAPLSYTIGTCRDVSFVAKPSGAQPQWTWLSWTLSTECTKRTNPEFKVYLRDPSGAWSLVQDWSPNPTFRLKTDGTTALGTYYLQFWMRAQGTTVVYEAVTPVVSVQIVAGTAPWVKSAFVRNTLNGTSRSIEVDSSNNVYVAGHFYRAEFNGTLYNTNGRDGFVVKLDSSGNWKWVKVFKSSNESVYVSQMIIDGDDIYVGGHFGGSLTLGSSTFSAVNSLSGFVAKLDTNGNVIWARALDSTHFTLVTKLAVHNGTLYVGGRFNHNISFTAGALSFTRYVTWSHYFITKWDTNGMGSWAHVVGDPSTSLFRDEIQLAVTSNGDAVIAGTHRGSEVFGTTTLASSGDFIAKVDSNGVWKWAHNGAERNGLVVHTDQSIYCLGDSSLQKRDANGALLWSKTYGVSLMGIRETPSGDIDISGYSEDDPFSFGGYQDAKVRFGYLLGRVNTDGVAIFARAVERPTAFSYDSQGNMLMTGIFYEHGPKYSGDGNFDPLTVPVSLGHDLYIWKFPVPVP
ncbi:MAG TPA: hypothetical protein DCE42_16780 [Myxococcales bacterium]|nr:hypothetical protein [Deltaproteobacteria bacterium]MBU50280.1 hypothetical protein [Deltaproteobacteria bacterium]HAA56423.1 hypothetical protein [Myxococcales bacterium]|tara:strand:+ start:7556 stop:9766 length:2211 start_codon:yes stop_codon:yes gene_type:complete